MKSRFTPEEIKRIVHASRLEGVAIIARQHGIAEQTLYNWRKRLGITDSTHRLGELKRLQLENARLKRLVAERDLDIDMMKEAAGKHPSLPEDLDTAPRTSWSEITRGTTFTSAEEERERAESKP